MLIDVHLHYGFEFFPIRASVSEDLIRAMNKFNIDVGIVSSVGGIWYTYPDCNREMYDSIKKFPDRLKGYIVVNPNYPGAAIRQLEEYSQIPQFVGVKVHPSWHNKFVDGPEYEPIFQKCEELNLPVLVHSYVIDDYEDQVSCPERIANVARKHKNPIIVAHMGGNSKRACKAIKDVDNLYMDISSGRERASQLYVWELGRVENAAREIGAEKILFGSDLPLLDPAICIGLMEDSVLSDKERELIMWKNSSKIFKINR
jgi:Predicted metal-dependent hydrolase of the TIM-barrel fold